MRTRLSSLALVALLFALFAPAALGEDAARPLGGPVGDVVTHASTPTTMAYCTPADVSTAYPISELAEVTGDPSGKNIDDERMQAAIDEAGELIEVHVRSQHPSNPFDHTHALLRQLNVQGAFLLLSERSPGGLTDAQRKDQERYESKLQHIATGRLRLFTASEEAEPEASSVGTITDAIRARPRLFGGHRQVVDGSGDLV